MALPKVIYIMGPPGAGKGTQAEMLAKELGYHQFSTGAAFRAVARKDSDLGRRVHEIINVQGKLAPPEMAAEIVIDAVKEQVSKGKGLVFDGTPRTVEEAAVVDKFFVDNDYPDPLPILLTVDREEMIRRNSQRKFCLDVETEFPVIADEDKARCESLGGRVTTRPDDDPEKFATRWDEFQNRTKPVADRYKEEGKLIEVDGMRSIAEVHENVMGIVNSLR